MMLKRAVLLIAILTLAACSDASQTPGGDNNGGPDGGPVGDTGANNGGPDAGDDVAVPDDTTGGGDAQWSRLDSPCEDTTDIALLLVSDTEWLAGCRGFIFGDSPRGFGLFRTTDGGASWSGLDAWADITVHDLAQTADGSTLVLTGTRFRRSGDSIEAVELVWRADASDAALTPSVLYEEGPTSVREFGTSLAVTGDGRVTVQLQNNDDLLVGTVDGNFSAVPAGVEPEELVALGDGLAALPDEVATASLDLLLDNRSDTDAVFERVSIHSDPEASVSGGMGLSYVDGTAYVAGLKMPTATPLVLANDGDLYDGTAWTELDLPLDEGIGAGVGVGAGASLDVLIGVSFSEPTTSWVAISEDGWTSVEMYNRTNMPEMARNLGEGSVELRQVRVLGDGAVLVWGSDGESGSGGYLARFGD